MARDPPTPPPTAAAMITIIKARSSQNVEAASPHIVFLLHLESSISGGYWYPVFAVYVDGGACPYIGSPGLGS